MTPLSSTPISSINSRDSLQAQNKCVNSHSIGPQNQASSHLENLPEQHIIKIFGNLPEPTWGKNSISGLQISLEDLKLENLKNIRWSNTWNDFAKPRRIFKDIAIEVKKLLKFISTLQPQDVRQLVQSKVPNFHLLSETKKLII